MSEGSRPRWDVTLACSVDPNECHPSIVAGTVRQSVEPGVQDRHARREPGAKVRVMELIAPFPAEGLGQLAGTLGQGGETVGAVEDPKGATDRGR